LVTIDAMGCQKQIGADIQEVGADYLLAVKNNRPTLNAEVTAIFEHCRREPAAFGGDFHETGNTGHGRTEIRRCWKSPAASEGTTFTSITGHQGPTGQILAPLPPRGKYTLVYYA
jgi:predicted transposase YbfD/YdcC